MSSRVPGREDSSQLALVRPTPRRIGRYEICFELAAGGMATIYLARVEGPFGFKKLVALKCIHPHLVRQAGFVEMFLDEARLASRISHPNVCSVFDFGFADATYYIAMEFLVGETLGRLCRLAEQHPELVPMPASAAFAARIVADAALGLHAAHELRGDDGAFLGLVHRDISPQNVMLSYDGAVKVMDFGIAKTIDQLHLTRTGTVRGKYPYMAPEQVEQGAIDRRTDIWSLGVLLWELLTGARLFAREREVDSIRAVLEAPIPPPSGVRNGVPRELDEIALRALARDPAGRFATAHELALALEGARGRRDAIASPAVLGDWLRALFPDLYARRLELVDQARQMNESSVPRVSRALAEPTLDTRPLRDTRSKLPASSAKRRRGRFWGVAFAGCALFGAAFWLYRAELVPRPARAVRPAAAAHFLAPAPAPALPAAPLGKPGAALKTESRVPPTDAPAAPSAGSAAPGTELAPKNTFSVATAPAPAAAHALRRGVVNVATPGGWADVFVAGQHRGRTPLQLELPEGRRVLVLRPFGQRPQRRDVLVRPGQVTRVVVPVHERAR